MYPFFPQIGGCNNVAPAIPFHVLKEITKDFSEDLLLGSGAYGKVYKGVYNNGEMIAVKLLRTIHVLDDEQFEREYCNLAKLQHHNIVRLVGFCHETRRNLVEYNGNYVRADEIDRILCLEYMHNGCLDKYLSDESNAHDWHICYRIIKGICQGLKYLHEELKPPIYHLDLKPANILLDKNMVPKITDFGLSRLLEEKETLITKTFAGTLGYLPREYIDRGVISNKTDIFSLGVIINKIMAGAKDCSKIYEMSSHEYIEHVHGHWRGRLEATPVYALELKSYYEQVKRCIEIALMCVEDDRHKRPTIGCIVNMLNETETMINFPNVLTTGLGSPLAQMGTSMFTESELLDVRPLRLCFPFEPNKLVSCPLRLTNRSDDHYVAFRCLPKTPKGYFSKLWQLLGILAPGCTRTYVLTMNKQQQLPPDMDMFAVVQSCVVPVGTAVDNLDENFAATRRERGPVHEATLAAVFRQADELMTSERIRPGIKIIHCTDGLGEVRSIDVHPTAPWVLVGHTEGCASVWDYRTQEKVMTVRVDGVPVLLDFLQHKPRPAHILSTKFIGRKDWFAIGDCCGRIHVLTCMPKGFLNKFKAHKRGVTSLAVHPTKSLLVSSSSDQLIKLWNWEANWACTGNFPVHTSSLVFSPQNDDTFASVNMDGTIKIWSIYSVDPMVTLDCNPDQQVCADYYTTGGGRWHYMITGASRGIANIWDLRTNTCIHQLERLRHGDFPNVGVADKLEDPPLLIVASDENNAISLLNSTDYRCELAAEFYLGPVYDMAYIKRIASLAIAFDEGIAIMEINHKDPSYARENFHSINRGWY